MAFTAGQLNATIVLMTGESALPTVWRLQGLSSSARWRAYRRIYALRSRSQKKSFSNKITLKHNLEVIFHTTGFHGVLNGCQRDFLSFTSFSESEHTPPVFVNSKLVQKSLYVVVHRWCNQFNPTSKRPVQQQKAIIIFDLFNSK